MAYLKLTGQQLLGLRNALRNAFDLAAFKELILGLNRRLEDYAGLDAYPNQVLAVLEGAEEESWVLDLLDAARRERPADPELARFDRELAKVALPHGFDPFTMCCLSGEYVMVSRSHLRDALRAMKAVDGKRILVVRDKVPPVSGGLLSSKTGKSLSVQLISDLKQHLGEFELVWIDLRSYQDRLGSSVDILPRDLARRLFLQLQYDVDTMPATPNDSQWSRWVIEFCDVFVSHARPDARNVWIVIDEFNKVLLPQATLDLVKQLVDCVRVTLPHFRLILLGFRDALGAAVLPLVEEDGVERSVSERDLVEFFLGAARQRRLTVQDDDIVEAAAEVLSGLDPTQDAYLEEVGRRARAALGRFAATGG